MTAPKPRRRTCANCGTRSAHTYEAWAELRTGPYRRTRPVRLCSDCRWASIISYRGRVWQLTAGMGGHHD